MSSIAPTSTRTPSSPGSASSFAEPTVAEVERAAGLRRMKLVATGFLVVAAVVYVWARTNEELGGWVGYVRAFAEAAMVGALADWFAVTALFRHPLGIPIPHTAIIPKRKDQIGRSLGEFVEGNFLTHEILGERLKQAGVGRRLGSWLSHPENARRASEGLGDALKGTLEVLDDREVQAGLERIVEARVDKTSAAPLVGRVVDLAVEGRHHQRLLDAVLTSLGGFLDDNKVTFRQRLDQESPWWVPEPIDDRIFEKIYDAVGRFIADVGADETHDVRQSIDVRVAAFAERLRTDPDLLAKGDELKHELLAHPDVRAWLNTLWSGMKGGMIDAATDADSELRQRLTASLQRIGEQLESDPELQSKIDDWVERSVGYVIEHYRSEVSDLIATTVERWDGESTSRKMELQVGRDLQFIRINGTLVGGLAGLAIHAIGQFLA